MVSKIITDDNYMLSDRIPVPGGWLLRTCAKTAYGISVHTIFIPSPPPGKIGHMDGKNWRNEDVK